MTQQDLDRSPAMQRAIDLLRDGNSVQAEEVVLQAARETEERFGADSPETASAYNDLGTVLVNVGNLEGGVGAYRRACAGPIPTEEDPLQDRLTYLMNLGMALQMAEQLDEAEAVLRQGLEGRLNFYGKEHPGYAFGLEPLASLLLRAGKVDDALAAFDETIDIFWHNGHPRVITSLALRAEAFKIVGSNRPPFEEVEQLPDELIEEMVFFIFRRAEEGDPSILSHVMQDLVPILKKRFGEDSPAVSNTLTMIVNLESSVRSEENLPILLKTIEEVIAIHERQGSTEHIIHDLQGLALTYSFGGRMEEALQAYNKAKEQASLMGNGSLLAKVRRNLGLFLAEENRDEEAEVELSGACIEAEKANDAEALGQTQAALGIFYQHRERLEEAKEMLSKAIEGLDPGHIDSITARGHLSAIETGDSCGCGAQGEALATAFRDFVLSRLPEDLLEALDVKLNDDGNFDMAVQLKRDPSEVELDHLNRVINHAITQFKQMVQSR